jgi:hypothetical protein
VEEVVERGYEGYVAKDEASAIRGRGDEAVAQGQQKAWTVEEDRWRRRISSDNGGGWPCCRE